MESDGSNNNHVKLSEAQLVQSEFGLPLEEAYKSAVRFYKEKEKSGELTVSYNDRVQLMALSKQVRLGPYAESSESAGWFDFVGSDMTKSWKELGNLNKEDAMASFVFMMDRVCPPFKNFLSDSVEAVGEASELQQISSTQQSAQLVQQQPNWELFEAQRKQIQDALNAQTFHQFSAYAKQQYPEQAEQVCTLRVFFIP
ncbi:unnamed protein product [Auanema sp. JU1783]|nr:unnamed protein product [Auanema sp. JU1783]